MAISHPTGSKVADLMREYVNKACPGLAYLTPDGFGFDDGCTFTCNMTIQVGVEETVRIMRSIHEAHHDRP